MVHGKEIAECSHKHGEDGKRRRDCFCEESNHLVHVLFKPIKHVARVKSLFAVPLRFEQSVEHALLHAVLCLYSQEVSHPCAGYAERKVGQDKQSHHAHSPVNGPGNRTRGHVDGALYGPHLGQTHHHLHHADRGIEHCLQPVAVPSQPQPAKNGLGGIFVVGYPK